MSENSRRDREGKRWMREVEEEEEGWEGGEWEGAESVRVRESMSVGVSQEVYVGRVICR